MIAMVGGEEEEEGGNLRSSGAMWEVKVRTGGVKSVAQVVSVMEEVSSGWRENWAPTVRLLREGKEVVFQRAKQEG